MCVRVLGDPRSSSECVGSHGVLAATKPPTGHVPRLPNADKSLISNLRGNKTSTGDLLLAGGKENEARRVPACLGCGRGGRGQRVALRYRGEVRDRQGNDKGRVHESSLMHCDPLHVRRSLFVQFTRRGE